MDVFTHVFAVTGLILLCAGWAIVQFLARAMNTKNHLDYEKKGCGHCAQHPQNQECPTDCQEK